MSNSQIISIWSESSQCSGPPLEMVIMAPFASSTTTGTTNNITTTINSNAMCQPGSCISLGVPGTSSGLSPAVKLGMKTSCSSVAQDANSINSIYSAAFGGAPFISAAIYKDASCKSLFMSYALIADGKCHSLSPLSLIVSIDGSGQVSIQEFLNADCSGNAMISSKFPQAAMKQPGNCVGASGQFMVSKISKGSASGTFSGGVFPSKSSATLLSSCFYLGVMLLSASIF